VSIIVLTPKPPQSVAAVSTDESLSAHLASDFLHLLGQEGRRFDSFEQLRDYAQARIDAASLAAKIEAPAVVEAPLIEAAVQSEATPVADVPQA
jgi:hypothetical protein